MVEHPGRERNGRTRQFVRRAGVCAPGLAVCRHPDRPPKLAQGEQGAQLQAVGGQVVGTAGFSVDDAQNADDVGTVLAQRRAGLDDLTT